MARRSSALALLILAAGCAPKGEYPSLAPRAIERELAEADIERPVPVPPDDPAVAERLRAFAAEAARGQNEFEAALPAVRSAVSRAGAAGSESWIVAQQALSRLEAARATTTRALAEMDAYAVGEANSRRLTQSDLQRLRDAVAAVQALADRQHEQIAALQGQLRSL